MSIQPNPARRLRGIRKEQNPILQEIGAPFTDSFNYMLDEGLDKALKHLNPVEFMINDDKFKLVISEASISNPVVPLGTLCRTKSIYPKDCRLRADTYRGKLNVRIDCWINDKQQEPIVKDLGDIPIMIRSKRCNLYNLSPKELVEVQEHENEWGGYFYVRGHQKLARMLLMMRRNYPVAISRNGWTARGKYFSPYGVSVRCVAEDHTATVNVLHYLTNNTAKLFFAHNKAQYFLPLMMLVKCLCDYTDRTIFTKFLQGASEEDVLYKDSINRMLDELALQGFYTNEDCKNHVGKTFRVKIPECPPWYTDAEVADYIIKNNLLIHLDNNHDKVNLLIFMTQKLFAFSQGVCKNEGADAVMMQEVLLSGHLYLNILKDKFEVALLRIKQRLLRNLTKNPNIQITAKDVFTAVKFAGGIGNEIENFLATGNLRSRSGLGLMQETGLVIVAENINQMRYMSHFKAVHRGAFFMQMRTTDVRKLQPDAWGFICPVHTPDGAPCGLLNHLTSSCVISQQPDSALVESIPSTLSAYGMISLRDTKHFDMRKCFFILLDGKVMGFVKDEYAVEYVNKLRLLKIQGVEIPKMAEIVLVPKEKSLGQYPGIFIFTGSSRMMRPVLNLNTGETEYIGTFEQIYLDIAYRRCEIYKGVTTHLELSKNNFLSHLARFIPLPDCNQSPRNMYQCQMAKQTMGTPCVNWHSQTETKMYRLRTPATPLFKTTHYDALDMDDFPNGVNAVVAVISHTGYDMEDAMIINRGSRDRGFARGELVKGNFITLDNPNDFFSRDPNQPDLNDYIDSDGLPFIGRTMRNSEPYYCYYSTDNSKYVVEKFSSQEENMVANVIMSESYGPKENRTVCVVTKVVRYPSVGDKFASRAGQKGICSMLWSQEDLPFSESGMVPDIIFNPHGFPSRMTVAMMVELMAGKSGASHGLFHDATPFEFSEDHPPSDYFGELLESAGYNSCGLETFYSGKDGVQMESQIFMGIVHYQRLRHMVADKWQVRSTGTMDLITRQPIKGRKKGGAVRFGEMERDCLIAHGGCFLLEDRLSRNSDVSKQIICKDCASMLSHMTEVTRRSDKKHLVESKEICRLCGSSNGLRSISIPYVFKVFLTELSSMGINLKLDMENLFLR